MLASHVSYSPLALSPHLIGEVGDGFRRLWGRGGGLRGRSELILLQVPAFG
jgi:hypothetical protein